MASLFLFGAGASFGSGDCNPHPPPLGSHLFDALAKAGGIATTVDRELAELFIKDFEVGMEQFRRKRPGDVTYLLRDMARYFASFSPGPSNLYGDLVRLLLNNRKHAVLTTTNYDLLIEASVLSQGLTVCYSTSGGRPGKVISVLKIHGSCNFLPKEPQMVQGITLVPSHGVPGILDGEDAVKVVNSVREIYAFCNSNSSLGPTLACYSRDKSVPYSSSFVREIQEDWNRSVEKSARIFVVGLRVHPVDEHIWKPLAAAKAPLFYVGFEPEQLRAWAVQNNRKHCYAIAQTFEQGLPEIARLLG